MTWVGCLKKGHPMVKDIYKGIQRIEKGNQFPTCVQVIWRGNVPNKIKCFYWLAMMD